VITGSGGHRSAQSMGAETGCRSGSMAGRKSRSALTLPHVPLIVGGIVGAIKPAARRERFTPQQLPLGVAEVGGVVDTIERRLSNAIEAAAAGTMLLRATTPIGRIVLGTGILVDALAAELEALRAPRAILISEPGAWNAVGEGIAAGCAGAAASPGHAAGRGSKRLAVVGGRKLASLRVSDRAIVAIGGASVTPGSSRRPTCVASDHRVDDPRPDRLVGADGVDLP
jgi:hypothetical protein